jgi:hypothetical protein
MADASPTTPTDLQDPLPESSWLWRRVFVFSVTTAVLWMLWGAITQLGNVALVEPRLGVPALLSLCKWIIGMTALMATYYMVAPSAEQIVKMMKTATLLRSGVQVSGYRTETPEGHIEEARTVGVPPAPPLPGAGEAIQAPDGSYPSSADDGPPWASLPDPVYGQMPPPHKG